MARALLGGLFIAAGGQALLKPARHAVQAEPLTDAVAPLLEKVDPRLPTEAETLVRITGAVQLTAGLLLATGVAPRPAAAVLAGTLVPATFVGHPFWQIKNPTIRKYEQMHFAKNLGLLGGLLLAAADTAGSPSLRWRAERALHDAHKSIDRAKSKASHRLHEH